MWKRVTLLLKEHFFTLLVGLSGFGVFSFAPATYISGIFFNPTIAQYAVLSTFITLTLVFSNLSFNVSNNYSDDAKKKEFFRNRGKGLFNSAILLVEAIIVRYALDLMRLQSFVDNISRWQYGKFVWGVVWMCIAIFGVILVTVAFAEAHADLSLLRGKLKEK